MLPTHEEMELTELHNIHEMLGSIRTWVALLGLIAMAGIALGGCTAVLAWINS